jgi:hypothetical protein
MKEPSNMDFFTEGRVTVSSQESGADPLVNPGPKRPDENPLEDFPQHIEEMLRRTNFTEEEVVLYKKAQMMNRMPLEEAITNINILYGLTEEIFEYRNESHCVPLRNASCLNPLRPEIHIFYYSPYYDKYRDAIDRRTLSVTTRLFNDEKLARMEDDYIPRCLKMGMDLLAKRYPEQDSFPHFVAKDATFTIDSKCFTGTIKHYAKMRYSAFSLFHGVINVYGEMLGPSIDDLIQILESLHDLNGKTVE